MQARFVIKSPIIINGQTLPVGTVFGTIEFPDQAYAEFLKARLNWRAMAVEFGPAKNPRADLPLADHLPAAKEFLPTLTAAGITTIGGLAAVPAKALQALVGTAAAGPLIRAAKRALAGVAERPRRPSPAPVPPAAADGDDSQGDGAGDDSQDDGDQDDQDQGANTDDQAASKPKVGRPKGSKKAGTKTPSA